MTLPFPILADLLDFFQVLGGYIGPVLIVGLWCFFLYSIWFICYFVGKRIWGDHTDGLSMLGCMTIVGGCLVIAVLIQLILALLQPSKRHGNVASKPKDSPVKSVSTQRGYVNLDIQTLRLDAAIRGQAEKPTGELTEADYLKVKRLDLGYMNINFSDNSTMSSLGKLKNLEDLNLVGCRIETLQINSLRQSLPNCRIWKAASGPVYHIPELKILLNLDQRENLSSKLRPVKMKVQHIFCGGNDWNTAATKK